MKIVEFLILISIISAEVYGLHITGNFEPKEFFQFLVKFGFQKTDIHNQKESYGYIFGNITSESSFSHPITFAVLSRSQFLQYYRNRHLLDKEAACRNMFNDLKSKAFHKKCNPEGIDLLRRVPCTKDQLCLDEDTPQNVIKDSQFTYMIKNNGQPRYWYISMVSCYFDENNCSWHYFNPNTDLVNNTTTPMDHKINYDIWFVNGSPNLSVYNGLKYQFSFDRQNTLEMYLLFWFCYVILLPVQLYAVRTQRHPVTRLFTVSLILEFTSLCFTVLHNAKFSIDGEGFPELDIAGDIFDIMSRTMFMLLLLLLAKGWAVTRLELTWKPIVFGVWICYGVVHILLYIWNKTEVDIIEEIDEYETWPGWLILGLRLLIMAWFVLELRSTMKYEHNMHKLHFLLHFGASSLVWLVYLPIIALVALQVSPLWRYKFLLGITYSADCMAFCVMTHLLWPTRAEQYLLLAPTATYTAGTEELDELNESPHLSHAASQQFNNVVNDEEEILFSRSSFSRD